VVPLWPAPKERNTIARGNPLQAESPLERGVRSRQALTGRNKKKDGRMNDISGIEFAELSDGYFVLSGLVLLTHYSQGDALGYSIASLWD
jgi:hypothetical protein